MTPTIQGPSASSVQLLGLGYACATMSTEQNKIIVRRFIDELWNRRLLDVANEVFSTTCITHQLRSGAEIDSSPRDPESLKKHVAEWLASFPDLHFEIEQMMAEGDLVVTRCVMRGTHSVAWFGVTPTRKTISIRMMITHRIVAGQIVEDWVLVDSLGFFQQLGLIPATEELMKQAAK